jgi:hypothetical protein
MSHFRSLAEILYDLCIIDILCHPQANSAVNKTVNLYNCYSVGQNVCVRALKNFERHTSTMREIAFPRKKVSNSFEFWVLVGSIMTLIENKL